MAMFQNPQYLILGLGIHEGTLAEANSSASYEIVWIRFYQKNDANSEFAKN